MQAVFAKVRPIKTNNGNEVKNEHIGFEGLRETR